MTRVYYDRAYGHLTIIGHSGADVYGNDLVCAALSALARVLILAAQRDEEPYHEGDGVVVIVSKDQRLLDSVCAAFEWMATEYPAYVSFMAWVGDIPDTECDTLAT